MSASSRLLSLQSLCLLLLFTSTSAQSGTPGSWICGEQNTGAFDGNPFHFTVNIPHPGNLTLNTTKCVFSVGYIEVYTESGAFLYCNWYGAQIMTFPFISSGNYKLKVFISGREFDTVPGTYDISTRCTSLVSQSTIATNAPSLPTNHPTDPSTNPTSPTELPSILPSNAPSILTDPSSTNPTNVPTTSRTKPATELPSILPALTYRPSAAVSPTKEAYSHNDDITTATSPQYPDSMSSESGTIGNGISVDDDTVDTTSIVIAVGAIIILCCLCFIVIYVFCILRREFQTYDRNETNIVCDDTKEHMDGNGTIAIVAQPTGRAQFNRMDEPQPHVVPPPIHGKLYAQQIGEQEGEEEEAEVEMSEGQLQAIGSTKMQRYESSDSIHGEILDSKGNDRDNNMETAGYNIGDDEFVIKGDDEMDEANSTLQ